ncbi:PepSY-associated TM helix domain-containing protein [Rhizomicrobium electricum]
MIRAVFTRLHRWVGLTMAGFLAVAGLTGSLIVFYQELDRALNPDLFNVPVTSQRLSPSALAARVEAQLPGTHVTLMSIPAPGRASEVWVSGKSLAYDQVFADPATGKVLGQRKWGKAGLSRAALMPMIYLFHYSLKLPGVWGIVLMGVIACLWSIDCFVAFVLTLPRGVPFWTKWGPAWRIKPGASAYRVQFDLHRAGGLWLWAVLFVLATSSVALNLPEQVFRPLLKTFTTLSPSYEDLRPPAVVRTPKLSFDDALHLARREADRPQWVFRAPGTVGVSYGARGDKGLDGFGLSTIVFDDQTGARVLHQQAGHGRLADIYAGMQYQLHSGRILGWPGRILVALAGLAVAMLSVTGVVIWLRKRHARMVRRLRTSAAAA